MSDDPRPHAGAAPHDEPRPGPERPAFATNPLAKAVERVTEAMGGTPAEPGGAPAPADRSD